MAGEDPGFVVRDAGPDDVGPLLSLIRRLAAFEREPDAVRTTEDDLREALFGRRPRVFALVADAGGEVVGMAFYFVTFSTWTGRHGLWLEDLFVDEAHRSHGVGRALVGALVTLAEALGYSRVEWSVLDWNEAAIAFYRSLGAAPQDDWTTWRLTLGTGVSEG